MIVICYPTGPLETNAYLIGVHNKSSALVIDPAPGSTSLIAKSLRENHWSLSLIVLTHSHWDHIADLTPLLQLQKVPVAVHRADAPNVEHPGSDGLPTAPLPSHHVDRYLQHGDLVLLENLRFSVIHTPGHSPGGISLYEESNHTLFSGDTLFRGGMGNLQLPTANPKAMGSSLLALAQLPPITTVYPGHGPSTTIQRERSWMVREGNALSHGW